MKSNSLKAVMYRIKLRKALGTAGIEELELTLDEVKRELERRRKNNKTNSK